MNINFYSGGPIVGNQYVEILKNHSSVKIQWDEKAHEHFFEYK